MHKSPNKDPDRCKPVKSKKKTKEKFKHELKHSIPLIGITKTQKTMIKSLYDNQLILIRGNAGTGKSYVSLAYACKEMDTGTFNQIVLCRPNIAIHKSIGFFPGTIEEKLKPWLAQQLAYIAKFVHPNVLELWIKNNKIVMLPLETIRGRSFERTCIILDEAQNLTMSELLCVSTRIGEESKLIFCGDQSQSDLKDNSYSIFADLLQKHKIEGTDVITFTWEDCVRSGLVKDLLRMIEKEKLS